MPKQRKPTQRQINAMIETCIRLFRTSTQVRPADGVKFITILFRQIGFPTETRELPESMKPLLVSRSAAGFLNAAQSLNLIKRPEHLKFVRRYRTLIQLEPHLYELIHWSGAFANFLKEISRKSLTERNRVLTGSRNELNALYKRQKRRAEQEERLHTDLSDVHFAVRRRLSKPQLTATEAEKNSNPAEKIKIRAIKGQLGALQAERKTDSRTVVARVKKASAKLKPRPRLRRAPAKKAKKPPTPRRRR